MTACLGNAVAARLKSYPDTSSLVKCMVTGGTPVLHPSRYLGRRAFGAMQREEDGERRAAVGA